MTAILLIQVAVAVVFPSDAFALAHGAAKAHLSAGIGLSLTAQEYGVLFELPTIAITINGGFSRRLGRSVSALIDLGYFHYGQGYLTSGWADLIPRVETTSIVTTMLGLELERSVLRGPAPFLSGAAGFGRTDWGDVQVMYLSSPSTTIATKDKLGPAFMIGAGLRGASSRRSNAMIAVRWVSIAGDQKRNNIFPLTIGVSF